MVKIQIWGIIVASTLVLVILELVRKRKLKEMYSLLWLAAGFVFLLFAIFPSLLSLCAKVFGIIVPANILFASGFLFVVAILLHYSIVLSDLTEKNKKMAQYCAMMKEEFDELKGH